MSCTARVPGSRQEALPGATSSDQDDTLAVGGESVQRYLHTGTINVIREMLWRCFAPPPVGSGNLTRWSECDECHLRDIGNYKLLNSVAFDEVDVVCGAKRTDHSYRRTKTERDAAC